MGNDLYSATKSLLSYLFDSTNFVECNALPMRATSVDVLYGSRNAHLVVH